MAWCGERIQVLQEATEPKSGETDGKVSSPARGIWRRNKCNKRNKAMFAWGFRVFKSVTRSVTCNRKRNRSRNPLHQALTGGNGGNGGNGKVRMRQGANFTGEAGGVRNRGIRGIRGMGLKLKPQTPSRSGHHEFRPKFSPPAGGILKCNRRKKCNKAMFAGVL